jgi:capsular polysaccharide export protein
MLLLEQVDKVYVVTSHMGFEALMLGKPVVTFGLPWYACWGLTDDRSPKRGDLAHRRYGKRTVEQLFAAAYIQYTRYIDPDTGNAGTIFDVIRHLADGKRRNDESRGTVYCVGMSLWKKAIVKPFLMTPSAKVVFVPTARHIPKADREARMLVWGRKDEDNPAVYRAPGDMLPVVRMEDGFLRSVGLGSNLKRPLSLVFDADGIYYDPRTPSALEQWLKLENLLVEEQERAARLRDRLVALKLSKYNVGTAYTPAVAAVGRRVLLVIGQVEGDASLRFGSPEIQTNAALIARVRADNPDAYIIYKPHPDVVAGNREGAIARTGGVPPGAMTPWDELVVEANIIDCIVAADELHTMTSQSGFEALLYGKTVHCYGRPFYSGWGLTIDHAEQASRGRAISLDALVYGTLIYYPRYIDPETLSQVSVEHVVKALESSRLAHAGKLLKKGFVARQCYKAIEIARTLR